MSWLNRSACLRAASGLDWGRDARQSDRRGAQRSRRRRTARTTQQCPGYPTVGMGLDWHIGQHRVLLGDDTVCLVLDIWARRSRTPKAGSIERSRRTIYQHGRGWHAGRLTYRATIEQMHRRVQQSEPSTHPGGTAAPGLAVTQHVVHRHSPQTPPHKRLYPKAVSHVPNLLVGVPSVARRLQDAIGPRCKDNRHPRPRIDHVGILIELRVGTRVQLECRLYASHV